MIFDHRLRRAGRRLCWSMEHTGRVVLRVILRLRRAGLRLRRAGLRLRRAGARLRRADLSFRGHHARE